MVEGPPGWRGAADLGCGSCLRFLPRPASRRRPDAERESQSLPSTSRTQKRPARGKEADRAPTWLSGEQVRARGSLIMLTCRISSSEELEQKGKELDLQAWAPRAGQRVGVGEGEGPWTSAFFFLGQAPAPYLPAPGTQ